MYVSYITSTVRMKSWYIVGWSTCIVRNHVLLFAYCRVHVVFGRVIEGEQFVVEIENQKVDTNHRPYADVRISNSGELVLVKGICVGAWSVLFPSPYSLCLQNGNSTKWKRVFKNRPYDLLMQYLCALFVWSLHLGGQHSQHSMHLWLVHVRAKRLELSGSWYCQEQQITWAVLIHVHK